MSRIGLAFRAFFRTLGSGNVAQRVERALSNEAVEKPAAPAITERTDKRPAPVAEKAPARSDALTLLATLQREARFVDLVQESLDQYSDAQIGAAARDVLRDSRKVLERLFAMQPLQAEGEGAMVDVPVGYDANRFRLTGQVAGQPPFRGRVVHPGWQATQCQIPVWTGGKDAVLVVAPAEVEVNG